MQYIQMYVIIHFVHYQKIVSSGTNRDIYPQNKGLYLVRGLQKQKIVSILIFIFKRLLF